MCLGLRCGKVEKWKNKNPGIRLGEVGVWFIYGNEDIAFLENCEEWE